MRLGTECVHPPAHFFPLLSSPFPNISEDDVAARLTCLVHQAGAKVTPTLADAHIILGIKETPLREVLNDPVPAPVSGVPTPRTQLMFSHTIKGQMYNMELLAKFVVGEGTSAPAGDGALLKGVGIRLMLRDM